MISVAISGGIARIITPHVHEVWNERIYDLGGRWDAEGRCWTIDARMIAEVRKLLIKHYGGNGSGPADTVSMIVEMDQSVDFGNVTLCGRVIARGKGSYTQARLGQGVGMLRGRIGSTGGSVRWTVSAKGTFLLHDVPRSVADRVIADPDRYDCKAASLYLVPPDASA